ncbi:melanoma antigen recognized by T-cells 1 isoform X2 [Dromaius novaehollandiae]|uniref:melanoma antigen recognized by T-cells 1 isoform X2 n=1 Tax=Dromaius novaehollandiae TaxID=8790 RepID=UPI000E1F8D4A|nr:melanoma antigen recognized by T-cells 1 isoform X2 [Dromaius novaehollandiae]
MATLSEGKDTAILQQKKLWVLEFSFWCWQFYLSLAAGTTKDAVATKVYRSSSMGKVRTVVGEGTILDCKMALREYRNFNSVVPDAPPAYDKIEAEQSPPPYSP